MSIISTTRASYQKVGGKGGSKGLPDIGPAARDWELDYLKQTKEAVELAMRTKNRVTLRRAISDIDRIGTLLCNRMVRD